jgi:hypothetical protein
VRQRTTPSAPSARSTALAWLGACVLLVVLAGAALGSERTRLPAVSRVEVVERSAERGPALVPPEPEGPRALNHAAARPRVVPRTRSVCTRGLPPPRAPTG